MEHVGTGDPRLGAVSAEDRWDKLIRFIELVE
jgi:hypothetical protein